MPLELISQQEAAKLLGVDRITVYQYTRRKKLMPFQRIGGRPVFNKYDVLAFAEERRQEQERKQSEKAVAA